MNIPLRFQLIRLAIIFGFSLTVAILLGIATFLGWVAAAPRSLETFIPVIESSLSAPDGRYKVKIDQAQLRWDGWKHPMDVRLYSVEIRTQEGQVFARLPEISLGLNILSLMTGEVRPATLILQGPVITLSQAADKTLSFGFSATPSETEEKPEEPVSAPEVEAPLEVVMAEIMQPRDGPLANLYHLAIRDARLRIVDQQRQVFFRATKLYASMTRSGKGARLVGGLQMSYENALSAVRIELDMRRNQDIAQGRLDLANIMPSTLSNVFLEDPAFHKIAVPISGQIAFQATREGVLRTGSFALTVGPGSVAHPRLDGTIAVQDAAFQGRFAAPRMIAIDNGLIHMEDSELQLKLQADLTEGKENIALTSMLLNGKTDNLPKFWPLGLSPISREWVTTNVRGGTVPKATCVVNIQSGDLQLPALPEAAVDAHIELADTRINYMAEHPPILSKTGRLVINGKSLTGYIDSGTTMKHTTMSKGVLTIPDLNQDNPRIELEFDASAPAVEVAQMLALPTFAHLKHLNFDAATIQGRGTGHVKLGFDFFAPRDEKGRPLEPDIDYALSGEFSDVTQKNFMHKFDLENTSGKFSIDEKGVNVTGEGVINEVPMTLDVKYTSIAHDGIDTTAEFKTQSAPVSALKHFGGPEIPGVKGSMVASGKVRAGAEKTLVEMKADIKDTEFAVKELNFLKPVGKPASLTVEYQQLGDKEALPLLDMQAEDIAIKGSAEWSGDFDATGMIALKQFKAGENDLALSYGHRNGVMVLELNGNSVDASSEEEDDDFSFNAFPAVDFKADVKRVKLGENREIANLKGFLNCSKIRCERADLSGDIGGKPFEMAISGGAGNRQLRVSSEDGGGLLRTLDINRAMDGGRLLLRGRYNDNTNPSTLNATLEMNDYTANNAPVLAKLLTVASLTGMLDTLQGKGIFFKKLVAPLTLHNDVITLKEAKTYGPAMGMTAEGTIRFPGTVMDLKGTVVPSYTVNSVLGNVPLFGKMLTGGEGQGVFAVRYSITGTGNDPQVSVNPLSILTPGFLRGLFDIFDQPSQPVESAPEAP